jgi:hypothetical protein
MLTDLRSIHPDRRRQIDRLISHNKPRALGIPSRVAIGFTPGELVNGTDNDTTLLTYQVTNRDAHAWTEIYFQGVG